MTADLPYLAADSPALAGVYRRRWEDFRVDEVPGPGPTGAGDHTWLRVEKAGLTTHRAAADLARALGVRPSTVGYSGLKDSRAVARQWMSVEGVDPARALALELPRLRVLEAARSRRKLRRGWHRGNAFVLRLRAARVTGPAPGPASPAQVAACVLERLARAGVPNYYGPQRFGTRGDTWRVGRALARESWVEAASLIAGRPLRPGATALDPAAGPGAAAGVRPDRGEILRARELFDAGDYAAAAAAWPRGFGQCARLAAAMARTGGDARRSLPVVGKRMLRLYASAYQSWLFNRVAAERVPALPRLLRGDLAWKHDSEALFVVAEPAGEQARADRFEISPTGPLVGRRMRQPEAEAAALESAVLAASGLRAEELESSAMRALTGRRRPLRFALADAAVAAGNDDDGHYLELRFTLPPGCYATSVLRELGRGAVVEAAAGDAATDRVGADRTS